MDKSIENICTFIFIVCLSRIILRVIGWFILCVRLVHIWLKYFFRYTILIKMCYDDNMCVPFRILFAITSLVFFKQILLSIKMVFIQYWFNFVYFPIIQYRHSVRSIVKTKNLILTKLVWNIFINFFLCLKHCKSKITKTL